MNARGRAEGGSASGEWPGTAAWGARAAAAVASALVLAALVAASAAAQAPPHVAQPSDAVAPVPAGPATLRGRVVHPDGAAPTADLPVALYALGSDGRPGLSGTRSDADGRFRFENISNDPSTVYLIGTQFEDVPFGRRVAFEAGQTELEVELPLRRVTADASALLLVGSVYKLDWLGAQLFVQVSQQLRNGSEQVVYVGEAARAGHTPALRARLPDGIREFVDGEGGLASGLVRDGAALSFWGPVYPGDQEVRYGYLIDGPAPDAGAGAAATGTGEGAEGALVELSLELPDGSGEVALLTPESDPRPEGRGLRVLDETTEIEGVRYVRSSLGGVTRGGRASFAWRMPAAGYDADALRIASAVYWIDLDDAAMRVSAELELEVDAKTRLLARPGEALLRLGIPEGAELGGVSGSAASLGVEPSPEGGLRVLGPLPPGRSSFGFHYQLPVQSGAGELALEFEREVGVLNVAVADTGVIVEGDRLHRQRPFRQGTRVYLHRQAYRLEPGERVDIRFTPLTRSEAPRSLTTLGGLALAAAAAAFLIGPLRGRAATAAAEPGASVLSVERETIYETLRDLAHDHETGKLDDADYQRMRSELRASALALLQREQAAAAEPPRVTAPRFCPGCGRRTDASWRFCSDCGTALAGAAGTVEPAADTGVQTAADDVQSAADTGVQTAADRDVHS